MSISGIQGQLLEVTVVGCFRLKNTEWISRQDPYVCLEYGSTKLRTRTCTDGGKNPVFQEKLVLNLIEGLREINVVVWNSNTLSSDDLIGAGKVQIQDALSRGYDDRAWPLQTKTGRYAGEVKLIMHYANANANANQPTSFMPYGAPSQHNQAACNYYRPPPSSALPPPVSTYQPQPYSSFSSYSYPPNMTSNTPPPPHLPYPPPSHESYPPQPYPPPSQPSPYSHSGYYTGAYPPPPY